MAKLWRSFHTNPAVTASSRAYIEKTRPCDRVVTNVYTSPTYPDTCLSCTPVGVLHCVRTTLNAPCSEDRCSQQTTNPIGPKKFGILTAEGILTHEVDIGNNIFEGTPLVPASDSPYSPVRYLIRFGHDFGGVTHYWGPSRYRNCCMRDLSRSP